MYFKITEVPEVNLAFALSATSSTPDLTFNKMKSVVEKMLKRYEVGNVRYGLISFGAEPTTHITFDQSIKQKDSLARLISLIPRSTGGPDLDKAITEIERLFNSQGARARPKSKKVAVVIFDKKSVSNLDVIRSKSARLAEQGVFVIPVAVGNATDDSEMEGITDIPERIVKVKKTDSTDGITDKVDEQLKKALSG